MTEATAQVTDNRPTWNCGTPQGTPQTVAPDVGVAVSCPSGRSFTVTGRPWGFIAVASLADIPKRGLAAVLLRCPNVRFGLAMYEREKASEFAAFLAANQLRVMCNLSNGDTVERIFLEEEVPFTELTEHRYAGNVATNANGSDETLPAWARSETQGGAVRLIPEVSTMLANPSGCCFPVTGKAWGCMAVESFTDLPDHGLAAMLLRDEAGHYGVALYDRQKAIEFADFLFQHRLRVMCNLSDGETVEKIFLEDYLTINELTDYRLHGTLPDYAVMHYR